MSINKDLAKLVLSKGTLFAPAIKHYPHKVNVNVQCDYCGKSNLDISIGYDYGNKEYDLCLKCASVLDNNLPDRSDRLTKMMQDSARKMQYTTNMAQDSTRKQYMTTDMMQDAIRQQPYRYNNNMTLMRQDSVIRQPSWNDDDLMYETLMEQDFMRKY